MASLAECPSGICLGLPPPKVSNFDIRFTKFYFKHLSASSMGFSVQN
jgi:hypothetical protein